MRISNKIKGHWVFFSEIYTGNIEEIFIYTYINNTYIHIHIELKCLTTFTFVFNSLFQNVGCQNKSNAKDNSGIYHVMMHKW
jgi:hypothetical protein